MLQTPGSGNLRDFSLCSKPKSDTFDRERLLIHEDNPSSHKAGGWVILGGVDSDGTIVQPVSSQIDENQYRRGCFSLPDFKSFERHHLFHFSYRDMRFFF